MKDNYFLSRIDRLVDATSDHELLTFINAFSGYNQIRLASEDEKNIALITVITDCGFFCYRVMFFGVKNVGATYQQIMNRILRIRLVKTLKYT